VGPQLAHRAQALQIDVNVGPCLRYSYAGHGFDCDMRWALPARDLRVATSQPVDHETLYYQREVVTKKEWLCLLATENR
jgi:hypothetical protein